MSGPEEPPSPPAVGAPLTGMELLPVQRRRPDVLSPRSDPSEDRWYDVAPARSAELDPAPAMATVREVVDFIGRGVAWPLRVDHSGSISLTTGVADLDSSVRLVLMTAPGERLMRPEFGCRIHDMVFESVNANTLGQMKLAVHEALARWEPRIAVDDVAVEPDPELPGLVNIHVGYRVRATNDRRNLVHPFYVIPQEGTP